MPKIYALVLLLLVCHINVASSQELDGSWPRGGGKLTIFTVGAPIEADGIELIAEPGILTQGTSPAPFAFFIPNSFGVEPGNVAFGTLGTSVTIDGPVELDVTVSASARFGDVSGDWSGRGSSSQPVFFCQECVPEPSGLMIAAIGTLGLLGFRKRQNSADRTAAARSWDSEEV